MCNEHYLSTVIFSKIFNKGGEMLKGRLFILFKQSCF